MRKAHIILIIVIILAATIRFGGSGRTFFNDEVVWVSTIENLFATGEPLQYFQCGQETYFYWHPPFWILAYSASAAIFGFTEFAFRLVPIIFGLATILAAYYLGRELYSRRTGIIAAFLMSVSSYHILYSQNVDIDGGILAFFNTAAVLFFVVYKKRDSRKHLYASLGFIVLSLFAKFSGFLPIFAMIAYSYLHDKKHVKKDALLLIGASLAALIPLFLYSVASNDFNIFTGPIEYALFTALERAGQPTIQQIIFNKAFYVATVSWMLTPFISALFLMALYRLKKDKNYVLLTLWALITYMVFFMSTNLDIQRYFAAALVPVFILTSRLVDRRVKFTRHMLYVILAAILVAAGAAFVFNVNDLQGYHNPLIIGSVYVIAAVLLVAPIKKYKVPILLGGFIGLSLFLVLSGSTWHDIQSETAEKLTQNAMELNFDYREVWGNKDVEYYLSPKNETINYCFPRLEKGFLEDNKVRYISVYDFRNEELLKNVSELCEKQKKIFFNGHLVGLTCVLGEET